MRQTGTWNEWGRQRKGKRKRRGFKKKKKCAFGSKLTAESLLRLFAVQKCYISLILEWHKDGIKAKCVQCMSLQYCHVAHLRPGSCMDGFNTSSSSNGMMNSVWHHSLSLCTNTWMLACCFKGDMHSYYVRSIIIFKTTTITEGKKKKVCARCNGGPFLVQGRFPFSQVE